MRTATPWQHSLLCDVLIVEDNPDGREALRRLLELLDCRVEVAADGSEGVRKALASHPGLALIDLGLPDLDGYQVAVRLRDALHDDTLLVAYTAWDYAEIRERVVQAGFDGHLVKPAGLQELSAWLECAGMHDRGAARGRRQVSARAGRAVEPGRRSPPA
jgi:DNA-binding response OmpR family regulator